MNDEEKQRQQQQQRDEQQRQMLEKQQQEQRQKQAERRPQEQKQSGAGKVGEPASNAGTPEPVEKPELQEHQMRSDGQPGAEPPKVEEGESGKGAT